MKDKIKFTYLVGSSLNDISSARKLNAISVILRENNNQIREASPDYYLNDISELKIIDSKPANKIMFYEIDVSKCPQLKRLNRRERLFLQDHFRRIQQHSLVMGQFMYLQAKSLNQNFKDWETAGVLHDIDYARAYYDMGHHGSLSMPILKEYNLNDDIVKAIEYHGTSKFWRTKFLLGWALHISEMFTKRFVHTVRKHRNSKTSEVTFNDFMEVYNDIDFRKNERLTRMEEPSIPFDQFKKMMAIYDRDIDYYPISRRKLFSLAKQSFNDLNIFPLSITHRQELANLGLINK